MYNSYGYPKRSSYAPKVRFSDSLDMDSTSVSGNSSGTIQQILADIEDLKVCIRKLSNLFRTELQRQHTLSRDNTDKGSDKVVPKRPTLDEELGLCSDQKES